MKHVDMMEKVFLIVKYDPRFKRRAYFAKATRRDGSVAYAVCCGQNEKGIHRFTLGRGVACWDWWTSLREAAEFFEVDGL